MVTSMVTVLILIYVAASRTRLLWLSQNWGPHHFPTQIETTMLLKKPFVFEKDMDSPTEFSVQ